MALLKITLPRSLRGNRSLESIFYHRYPKLKRRPITRLVSLNILAVALNLNSFSAKNYLIFSKSIHGFESQNKIYIHPDGVLKLMRRHAKRQIRNILTESPTV